MTMHNPPHPGTLIREDVLEPLGLQIGEAARRLRMSRVALSRVLNGRARISSDLAIRLEQAGVSTARFWISAQAYYDLAEARKTEQPKVERLLEPAAG